MIRPQQNDEPASQRRSFDATNVEPGRGNTEPVAEVVEVVGGGMPGKGCDVNTGYPWGRTMKIGRAGVRAPIVVMKRVTTVERRECRKVSKDEEASSHDYCASAHRAKPHRAMSLLRTKETMRRTQSKQRLVSGSIASWVQA